MPASSPVSWRRGRTDPLCTVRFQRACRRREHISGIVCESGKPEAPLRVVELRSPASWPLAAVKTKRGRCLSDVPVGGLQSGTFGKFPSALKNKALCLKKGCAQGCLHSRQVPMGVCACGRFRKGTPHGREGLQRPPLRQDRWKRTQRTDVLRAHLGVVSFKQATCRVRQK